MTDPVSRRGALRFLGAASTALIAGCGSGSAPNRSATARTDPTTTTESPSTNTDRSQSDDRTDYRVEEFVERDGATLRLGGGEFRYNGMMALLTHTEFGKSWVDTAMDLATAYDVDVFRCWGFTPPWDDAPVVHQGPGEFDDEWLELFDYTVARAKEVGVRLIVPLLQGVHLDASEAGANYAPSPAAYGTWSDTTEFTGRPREFIEDEQANEYFKEYVEHLLTRENHHTGIEYRNEPAILAWECANELEYKGNGRGDSLAFWYEDIASFVKSLDPNHLVSTGMHGSMGEIYEPWTERCAYVRDHEVDGIDLCSFHGYPVYPFGDGVRIRSRELAARYARHKVELAHETIGKPVYCGEYGTEFDPTAGTAYVSRLESEAEAADVESNADYPMAYPDQHDDGVLVTREESIDGVDFEDRRTYFRTLTEVAAQRGMDGVQFWRLGPNTAWEGASDEEVREHRIEASPLLIYPRDEATFEVIADYASRVAA